MHNAQIRLPPYWGSLTCVTIAVMDISLFFQSRAVFLDYLFGKYLLFMIHQYDHSVTDGTIGCGNQSYRFVFNHGLYSVCERSPLKTSTNEP